MTPGGFWYEVFVTLAIILAVAGAWEWATREKRRSRRPRSGGLSVNEIRARAKRRDPRR